MPCHALRAAPIRPVATEPTSPESALRSSPPRPACPAPSAHLPDAELRARAFTCVDHHDPRCLSRRRAPVVWRTPARAPASGRVGPRRPLRRPARVSVVLDDSLHGLAQEPGLGRAWPKGHDGIDNGLPSPAERRRSRHGQPRKLRRALRPHRVFSRPAAHEQKRPPGRKASERQLVRKLPALQPKAGQTALSRRRPCRPRRGRGR